jgi:cell division protein FtsB
VRRMQNNLILVIAVIVSLALGGGGAYVILSSQVTTLTNEKAVLQTQNDYLLIRVEDLTYDKNQLQNQIYSLTDEKMTLQTQISTLNNEKTSLQTQINSLTSNNTALANTIDSLAATIDAMHSSGLTQTATYNISAGTEKTQSFILDQFGIVWDTVVDFSGTSVNVRYYYWYQGERYYVISYSGSLTRKNDPDIPYYGPQDYLYGTIKLEISPDWKDSRNIWINYLTITQFPQIRMGGNMFVNVGS